MAKNKIQVEAYCEASNFVVIQTPGRNFPGLVLQGDQLRGLLRTVQRLKESLRSKDTESCLDEVEDLEDSLLEKCIHYERVLDENRIDLPYPDRIRTGN